MGLEKPVQLKQMAILVDDLHHFLSNTQKEINDALKALNTLSLALGLGTLEELQSRNYEESNHV